MPPPPTNLSPTATHAIVVGIGQYADPKLKALHAPVDDAIRFTEWLLKRGVPPANIQLFLSRTSKNTLAAPSEVRPRDATQANIMDAIENQLKQRSGELFWLYWGGHGLVQKDSTLRLLYQDATTENLRNLDLNALVRFLRTDFFKPPETWRQQIFVVDACRTFASDLNLEFDLPSSTFPQGVELPSREQFTLFSAHPGEYAWEEYKNIRAGVLSRELQAQLETAPNGVIWPPNLEAITSQLIDTFIKLREQGLAKQTPAFLCNRAWDTKENNFSDIAPQATQKQPPPPAITPSAPRPRMALADKIALRDALLDCPSMSDHGKRNDLLRQLRSSIAHSVPYIAEGNGHVINIIDTCLRYPGGIAELLEIVRGFDGVESVAVVQLDSVIAKIPAATIP